MNKGGLASSRRPFVWDIHGKEVTYDLEEPQGKRNQWTVWDVYQGALCQAQRIVARRDSTQPAYCAACKLCQWYSSCLSDLEQSDDLTLLPELGRAKREVMVNNIPTVADLAEADVDDYVRGKKTIFRGVGFGTLEKFHNRAVLTKSPNGAPYLKAPIKLPTSDVELFFDIEVDPMRDLCYLHGFVERRNGDRD